MCKMKGKVVYACQSKRRLLLFFSLDDNLCITAGEIELEHNLLDFTRASLIIDSNWFNVDED